MKNETSKLFFSKTLNIKNNHPVVEFSDKEDKLIKFCKNHEHQILLGIDDELPSSLKEIITSPSYSHKRILILSSSTIRKSPGIHRIPEKSGLDFYNYFILQENYIGNQSFPSLKNQLQLDHFFKDHNLSLAYYRINFNFSIYRKAAARFIDMLTGFQKDFILKWKAGDTKQAYYLLHSLKNQAGVLGLSIFNNLEIIHDKLWDRNNETWLSDPVSEINSLKNDIEISIKLLQNYLLIIPYIKNTENPLINEKVPEDAEKLLTELEHIILFRKIINSNETEKKISSLKSPLFRKKFTEIGNAINEYEYTLAGQRLISLKKELYDKGFIR